MSKISDFFGTPTGSAEYLIKGFAQGTLEDSETLVFDVAAYAYTLPVGLTGSVFRADSPPNTETILELKKNGTIIGTATFDEGVAVATISFTNATSFSIGDRLEVDVQFAGDSQDIAISIKGDI
ncbi:hypothetical protein [Vibrio phage VCPH]|nr:hypothetical protein [Vibrio phage VCPH]